MRYLIKKIYLILCFLLILLNTSSYGKDTKFNYTQNLISNYFSGIISINQDHTRKGFKYLNKVKSIKNVHNNYNIQYLQTLVLLEKFKEAFSFSEKIWAKDQLLFEADLLLGIRYLVEEDYKKAEEHFKRLNVNSPSNLYFSDYFENVFISWIKAFNNEKEESFKYFEKIPQRYEKLKLIQNSFLNCYFETSKTEILFEEIISKDDFNFSRYNFFLGNYFLSKKQDVAAKVLFDKSTALYSSNLLIKQSNNFILNNQSEKIKNFFNCKNPRDVIAEMLYIVANLYSTQENYKLSNFYLKISLFLNSNFVPNKTLLAENLYSQKRYIMSNKVYDSLKTIGPIYSWYASLRSAMILSNSDGKERAIKKLKKELKSIQNPNFENYYEMANFLKNKESFDESIKYYSLALKNIKPDHYLVPKILDRRGTSYERIGEWNKAEKDLKKSLKISPDQPYVLNYLAYSWIDKGINIDESLSMLKKAMKMRQNDGYITDSLGWAYYLNKNYLEAEKYLQRAVELMPHDPVINDHYADLLWKRNKNIQARYFWKYVLTLKNVEQELKDKINKKLIFGIKKNS
tara:strand:- start:5936 stop:7651 length:1716 start_codon:yes stop_codon:yes gene_type:complete